MDSNCDLAEVAKHLVARRSLGRNIEPAVIEVMIEDMTERLDDIVTRIMVEEVERLGLIDEVEKVLDSCDTEASAAYFASVIPHFQDFIREALRTAIKELGG